MRKKIEPSPNGVGVELGASARVTEVGAGGEGSRQGVMVRSKKVGRVDLVEELEGVRILVGTSKI